MHVCIRTDVHTNLTRCIHINAHEATTSPRVYSCPASQDVTLSNLQPATVYFYQFGNDASSMSPVYNFKSAPALGDASKPLTVIAYADLGAKASSRLCVTGVPFFP